MKYLKYLCSSLLLAGALSFGGCGSDGDTRADGDRNVAVQITIDREIKVEGVVRSYKTGAPLDTIEVRLYQGGVKKSTTTASKDGHYAFAKIKVSDDKSVSGANNAANAVQLEFVELKVKNSTGGSGNTHYANGTTTPTYPDSRVEFTYVSPEFTTVPVFSAADQAATVLAGNLTAANGAVSLVDAINEGRSYYWTDANTVLVRDIRLVQAGSLTGTVADRFTGLPISGATITIDQDSLFLVAGQYTVAGDIISVWQQTRISTTSDTLGAFTLSNVPALDYQSIGGITETFHVEALGYTQTAQAGTLTMDHANIQDDLIGSVGVWLLDPIRYDPIAMTMKIVDQNLSPLSGVTVTFTYDASIGSNPGSGYGTGLANGIFTETVWTFTSDANGLISGNVPNISFTGGNERNLTVVKSGYALQGYDGVPNFSQLNSDDSPVDLDVSFAGLTIFKADLGVIQMVPISVPMGEKFTVQLVYNGNPLKGVTATGFAAATHPITGFVANYTFTSDEASDSNGFISFSGKIPSGLYDTAAQGVVLTFNTSAATNGITGADYSALNLKLDTASDAADTALTTASDGKMDFNNTGAPQRLSANGGAGGILLNGESGSTVSAVFEGSDKTLGTLQGFLVEGTQAKTAGVVAGQTVGLSVTPLSRLAKTYFSTTDSTGKYIFTSSAAPAVPVSGTAYGVKIPVGVNGANDTAAVARLLKLKLMDTSKVFSIWITNAFATNVTDGGGLATDGSEIWLNSSTNIATRNGIDQISSGTNTWLEQLNGDNGGTSALLAGYADQTLTVHTAQIQDITKLQNGFHVLTLVDGSDAKPVIYTSDINSGNSTYAQRTVYTFATSGDSDSIKIIMSGAVDYTKTWIHTGGAQATTENKVTINATGAPADTYNVGNGGGNDTTTLGTTFVYDTSLVNSDTTAAVGRSIVITPAGNADKFELGVIYRVLVSVYDANGNKSDDTIEFRFFDKPAYANMTPTLAVNQMFLQNEGATNRNIGHANSNIVAADLEAYSIAWNDKGAAGASGNKTVAAREVSLLLNNLGANTATAALGSFQSTSIKLSLITLRFPNPTKANGDALTTAELAALDTASDYRVYAQSYRASDKRIIRNWTNVTTYVGAGDSDDAQGSSFSSQTAGYWTISCDLETVGVATFANSLANGDSVDLAIVYKDNQIDATKVITLNGTRKGVQPAALLNGAGNETHLVNINFATSTDVIVTLNESTNATDTSVPTMTTGDARLTLASPRYINDQQIQGQLTWVAPTPVPSATLALSATANTVLPTSSSVVVGTSLIYVPNAFLTSTNNTSYAPLTNLQNKLDTVSTFANNAQVNRFQSYTFSFSVANDQTIVVGTNAAGATSAVVEDNSDNSTLTHIDIDWAGIANLPQADSTTYTNTTADMPFAAIWGSNASVLRYANCNDEIKAFLNTLPAGYRLYFSNGSSIELLTNVANTSWAVETVNANATAGTGDTTNARATVNINAASSVTNLFTLTVFGRIETAASLVASPASTTAGSFQNSATVNNNFGLRSAVAITAVPVTTTSFTYTDPSAQQRLRVGDTLYISQKQSAIGDVWNHFTAPVTAVLSNGTANLVKIGTVTAIDGTTATTLVFTQGVAVTDMHVVFYGDQVTVGLGLTGTTPVTGIKTAAAGNTASSMISSTMGISFPSQLASVSNQFKDASTNSLTSVVGAGLTFGGTEYDIFVR